MSPPLDAGIASTHDHAWLLNVGSEGSNSGLHACAARVNFNSRIDLFPLLGLLMKFLTTQCHRSIPCFSSISLYAVLDVRRCHPVFAETPTRRLYNLNPFHSPVAHFCFEPQHMEQKNAKTGLYERAEGWVSLWRLPFHLFISSSWKQHFSSSLRSLLLPMWKR